MAQGSSNFHWGQMEEAVKRNAILSDGIPNLIIGAPGISMGRGGFVGPPRFDGDTRKDFYQEIIVKLKAKKIMFHHWDDFNKKLDDAEKITWFRNFMHAFSTKCTVDNFVWHLKKQDSK